MSVYMLAKLRALQPAGGSSGPHNHTAAEVTDLGSAATKEIGLAANQVASGDHAHSQDHTGMVTVTGQDEDAGVAIQLYATQSVDGFTITTHDGLVLFAVRPDGTLFTQSATANSTLAIGDIASHGINHGTIVGHGAKCGDRNTTFGRNAGSDGIAYSSSFGDHANGSVTGLYATAMGFKANNNGAAYVSAQGGWAGASSSGLYGTYQGYRAGEQCSGDRSTAQGAFAGKNNTEDYRVDVGAVEDPGSAYTPSLYSGSAKPDAPYACINGELELPQIPTSDPAVAGRIWSDGGTLKRSAG
ncbi:hypothetical protein [Magnetococcus sp. PR-3]|uniref:hypothetical protein n=1 Tax=Magnetococcus sp. PR-3 TaxID=3120355 RepID=UPI002FCE3A37